MPYNVKAIRNLRGEDETDIGYDPNSSDTTPSESTTQSSPPEEKQTEDTSIDNETEDESIDDLFSDDVQPLNGGKEKQSKDTTPTEEPLTEDTTPTEEPLTEDTTPTEEPLTEDTTPTEEPSETEDELPSLNNTTPSGGRTPDSEPQDEKTVEPTPEPEIQRESDAEENTGNIHEPSGLPMDEYKKIQEEIQDRKVDNDEHTTTQLKLDTIAKIIGPVLVIVILSLTYLVLSYIGILSALVTTVPALLFIGIGLYFLAQDFTPDTK